VWADALQSSEFFFGRRHPTIAQRAVVDEFLLQTFNERVTAAGARLIILYVPDYFGPRVVPAPEHLIQLARRLDVDFIDLTSDLQAELSSDPNSIKVPNDGHLNERGHELMARRLYESIENMSRGRRGH
jgi:lysophospholipase L1-like esterase